MIQNSSKYNKSFLLYS